jgi:MFS superfamily sulfate permease-like transporter
LTIKLKKRNKICDGRKESEKEEKYNKNAKPYQRKTKKKRRNKKNGVVFAVTAQKLFYGLILDIKENIMRRRRKKKNTICACFLLPSRNDSFY